MPAPSHTHTLASGRYRLLDSLGEGGMAQVFRAVDTEAGTGPEALRAIKVLRGKWAGRPKTRQRLENEAAVMMGLSHPNVVTVHGLYSGEDEVFIIMELLPGGSVWDVVEAHGQLPGRVTVDLCLEVLEALELAHEHGIVHRDIKPHNVLLTADGHAKVTDFGIARVEDSGLTRTGVVMGTLAYMPPEQKLSARKVDARADLYAVGAMLWACLTGREPHDLYAAGMDDTVAEDYFADVPQALVPVILEATRFAPEGRYDDAASMMQALRDARAALPHTDTVLADLIDERRATAMQDADATVIPDEGPLRRAPSTYPDESASLTPILPPRRDRAAIQPLPSAPSQASLPEPVPPSIRRTVVAAAVLLAIVGLGLATGALMAGAWWGFGAMAGQEPQTRPELPGEPPPADAAPAAAAPPAPTRPVEAAPSAPEPASSVMGVPSSRVATPSAPEPASATTPAPTPPVPESGPATTPEAPALPPAPAPAPYDDGMAEASAPVVRVVEAPAPAVRITPQPMPEPVEAPAPVAPAPPAAPVPAPPPAAAGGWTVTTLPGSGSRVRVTLTLEADRTVTTGAGATGRPKLLIVCDRRAKAYFDPGVPTEMVVSETGADLAYANVSLDGDVQRLTIDNAEAQTALGLGRKWIPRMRGGGRWTVGFVPSGADPTEVQFTLSGLDALMTERFDPHCKS